MRRVRPFGSRSCTKGSLSPLPGKAAALAAALALLALPAGAAESTAVVTGQGTIRVVAEATTPVKPDLAELDLGVVTHRPTAAAAVADNARRMEQLVTGLKRAVGANGEIKTVGYSLAPRFGRYREESTPSIVGYTASNTVQVRTAEVNAVGQLLDQAFKLGANAVNRIAFTLKDPEPAQTESLRAAATKARARATAFAAGLGLRLGPVVSATERCHDNEPFEMLGGFGSASHRKSASYATPVEAGTLQVGACVTLVFAIAGK